MGSSRQRPPAGLDPTRSGRVRIEADGLRFGTRTFHPADVVSFRIESAEQASLLGNICGFVVFTGLAALILEAIVGQIFPPRTLIAVVALGLVGVACVEDTWRSRGNGFYRLFLTARSGPGEPAREVMVFATSVRQEVEHVADRLSQALPVLKA